MAEHDEMDRGRFGGGYVEVDGREQATPTAESSGMMADASSVGSPPDPTERDERRRYQTSDDVVGDPELARRVRGLIARSSRAQEDVVDDLVQETFFRVHIGWKAFEFRSKVSTWAFTIARRVVVDHYRSQTKDRVGLEHVAKSMETLRIESPTAEVGQNERTIRAVLRRTLEELPTSYRELVEARYAEGLTLQDIADRFRQPLNTIHSRIKRALYEWQIAVARELKCSKKDAFERLFATFGSLLGADEIAEIRDMLEPTWASQGTPIGSDGKGTRASVSTTQASRKRAGALATGLVVILGLLASAIVVHESAGRLDRRGPNPETAADEGSREARIAGSPSTRLRSPTRRRPSATNSSPASRNVASLVSVLSNRTRVYAMSGTPPTARGSGIVEAQQPIPLDLMLGALPPIEFQPVGDAIVFAFGTPRMRCEGASRGDSLAIDCRSVGGDHVLYIGAVGERGTIVGEAFAVQMVSGTVALSHFDPGSWYLVPDVGIDWDTHHRNTHRCVAESGAMRANPSNMRHIRDLHAAARLASICSSLGDASIFCRMPIAEVRLKPDVDVFGVVRPDDIAVEGASVEVAPGTQTAWKLATDFVSFPNDEEIGFRIGTIEGHNEIRWGQSTSNGVAIPDIEMHGEEVVYLSRTTLVFPLLVGDCARLSADVAEVFACLDR